MNSCTHSLVLAYTIAHILYNISEKPFDKLCRHTSWKLIGRSILLPRTPGGNVPQVRRDTKEVMATRVDRGAYYAAVCALKQRICASIGIFLLHFPGPLSALRVQAWCQSRVCNTTRIPTLFQPIFTSFPPHVMLCLSATER